MSKHERAKLLIEKEVRIHRDVMVQAPSHPQHPDWEQSADALTYALKVLEAVDREIHPDTVECLADMGFTEEALMIQAILDAKADNV
jgi:hypothetical protein